MSDGGDSGISGECSSNVKERQLDEHQSVNITATHSSIVHLPQFDRHNPCCSVEVAIKDRAMIQALTENTVNKDLL